jgi:ABC-type Fe3+-hydroxamate transport system substrate-binding protein
MKQLLLTFLLGLLCAGCSQHYNITLSNNNMMSTRGKPKYDKATETYKFTDAMGRPGSVPAFRVKEIAPQ